MTRITALEKLADNAKTTLNGAERARNERKDRGEKQEDSKESRYAGASFAYSNSHRIMKAELERLKNLFQNGALTMDDFTV